MIANLAELDPFVEREVIEPFDQKYLNEEVPEFRQQVPTTENVCREIFRRLKSFPRRGWSACASKKRARTVLRWKRMWIRWTRFEYEEEPRHNERNE